MIITYTTTTPTQRTRLHRALYGYMDYSKNGQYKYQRKGLLNKIKHEKINKATIKVKKEKAPEVIKLLKKQGVKYKTFA